MTWLEEQEAWHHAEREKAEQELAWNEHLTCMQVRDCIIELAHEVELSREWHAYEQYLNYHHIPALPTPNAIAMPMAIKLLLVE